MNDGIQKAAFFRTADGGLRPYVINGPDKRIRNPHLIIANPKKKGTKKMIVNMRRNRKGQFVKGNPRKHHHHKKHKKNFPSAGGIVPMMNRKKSKRRHNPPSVPVPFLGTIEFPIGTIAGVTAGFAGPSLTTGLIVRTFPTQAAAYPTLVTIGSYLVPPAIAYAIGGKTAVRDVVIGEVAGFLVKQIQTLAPNFGLTMQGLARPAARGRQRSAYGINGYTGPTRQLMGYTSPTTQRQLRGINGGIGQINRVARGARLQSRFGVR